MQQTSIVLGATAVSVLALLAAGCGGTSGGFPVASIGSSGPAGCRPHCLLPATASQAAAAAKAARCMRSHGVPNFPDPINGHFGFTVSSGIDPDTPQFKRALGYCGRRYLPGFDSATPAQRARWNAAAVKYSQCMRSHGVSDFPDPEQGRGAIDLPSADYDKTPKVQRGMQACKPLLTGKGFVFVVPVH